MIQTNHGLNSKASIASGGQALPTAADAYEVEFNMQMWETPVKTEHGRAPFRESKGDLQSGFTVPIPTGVALTHTPQGVEKIKSISNVDYFSTQFHEDKRKSESARPSSISVTDVESWNKAMRI